MAAVAAVQAQETVGQDAAFQEGVELDLAGRAWPVARPFARHKQSTGLFVSGLSFDELRQVGAGRVFGLGEKGRRVLLHQSGQRGLFRAVGTVMSLYGRATGRAFVATLPSHKIDAVLAGPLGLHGAPPTSTRQRQREDKTIETEFRSHGLLRVVGTPLPGINAFSAPVFDHEGQVALVITLLGAQESFAPDWDAPAAQALRAAAKEVSERLGVKLNSN